jgi:predicted ATPase/class 3 adenylate cyclase
MSPSPTFLFTDIEGSTSLWEEHPEAMGRALLQHDDLLRACIESHGGRVFKTMGDAFCAAFTEARGAVEAVLASQGWLPALALETVDGSRPLRVRMALHTGVAEERDGDYFGQPLNRLARLLAIGHGGQVLLSLAAAELVQGNLPCGVSLTELGEHRLKDLGRPETVFQLCHPGLPAEFPPLRSLDSPDLQHNLPQQLTSFVGRGKELAEVKALLDRTRLLTLTGAGGCGKTRLALQSAAGMLEDSGDAGNRLSGCWLVELAPLSEPSLVPQTVASALGLKEEPGRPVLQTLTEHLKSKHLLLILDNCEHLLESCAQVADAVLRGCPGVLVLATSREGLGISGETLYRVPSLSLPDRAQPHSPESLSRCEAARLFIERAAQVRTGFSVTDQNAPALASVCSRLDGIPLAIELAAARVRSLSVEEINGKLDQRFRLLTGGSRTALPRQQTLRSLIDWSYDLLGDAEKALIRRLSVFAGGWTLEAAEATCSDDERGTATDERAQTVQRPASRPLSMDVDRDVVLDLLTSLCDKNLLVAEQQEGATRYRLLETVRQYARERLLESGEGDVWRRRHLECFLALAEEAEPHLAGADQAAWLERLEREHDNLRAALEWSAEAPDGAASGLRLAGLLWRFWDVRGHLAEGRDRLSRALAQDRGADPSVRAGALNGAGVLAQSQGDYPAARGPLEESLAIRRELVDRPGMASSLNNLGIVGYEQGDYPRARSLHEASLAIRRELGDRLGIALSLGNLGNVACAQADYPGARALYEESLAIMREQGHRRGVAILLNNLGNAAYERGDYPAARALLEESLGIMRELGDGWVIAYSLGSLGEVAREQGDYAASRALHQESLVIRRELGDRLGIASSLEALAALAVRVGAPLRAARLWGAAEGLRDEIGCPTPANQRARYEGQVASARTALADHGAFDGAWAEGRGLTLEPAIELALEHSDA